MQQFLIITLCTLIVCSCSEQRSSPSHSTRAGMANPASVYCAKLGGVSQPYQTTAGVASNCHLPDGTAIDEWVLYRRDHP